MRTGPAGPVCFGVHVSSGLRETQQPSDGHDRYHLSVMDDANASRERAPWEELLAVVCMASLALVTLLNVLTRYFSDQSFAWTEEISVFLMVLMTLAGAAAAAARDRHIRIEFFYEGGSPTRQRRLRVACAGMAAAVFAVLALLFSRMLFDEIRYAETSMGLGVPRWWYTVFSPLLCAWISWRCIGALRRAMNSA
jgi:TRAP-type transport system small permease protein